MRLEASQKLAQSLSPQMIQSAKVLQMGVQELREYVEQETLENPVLELSDEAGENQPAEVLLGELEYLEGADRHEAFCCRQDAEDAAKDSLANVGRFVSSEGDLDWYILSQFLGTALEPEVIQGVQFLIERLDENGWLSEDLPALTAASGLSPLTMERAITELQAAEPAGVGARDLSECLRLQIERWAGDHRLAIAIVEGCLPELARGRYHQISQKLGAPEQEVRSACDFIRSLNPRPASGFASQDNLSYIIPDVVVTCFPDHIEVSLSEAFSPHLSLSSYYLRLLKETADPQVQTYLTERVQQAKQLIKNVEQRQGTLRRCALYLVRRQEMFFRRGPGHLAPLTMEQAAEALDLHISTVSRAVRDKYLQCGWGVYPLNYLFSRPMGTQEVSVEAGKELLKKLIGEEGKPLSDQKLSEEMARRGYPLSRRTVAKYREELGIPAASGRKK